MRLLVVEDEPRMADLLRRGLGEEGFAVDVAGTAADAVWFASENEYDGVVLDVLLPDGDGFDVLTELRAGGRWAPVLMLTARDALEDRVRGLDLGADDYMIKPFELPELTARLRALIRRGVRERPAILVVGDLVLDPATRVVRRGDTPISLTAKEFAVLEVLMRRAGEVVSKTELMEHVWDFAFDPRSNVVEVYVGYLRQKIDRAFGRTSIETLRGAGYRLRGDGGTASLA
jgi:two-component system OmpR family response regulator